MNDYEICPVCANDLDEPYIGLLYCEQCFNWFED